MSYKTIEIALADYLITMPEFNADTVARGDLRILAKGPKYAIRLSPGGVGGRQPIAVPRKVSTDWTINIELWILFQTEVDEIHDETIDMRQKIFDHLDDNPTLGALVGLVEGIATSANEPEIWQGENRNYWVQRIAYSAKENVYRRQMP